MSALADAVADLLAALAGNGVPATADPDLVAQLVAAHGAAALVLPPDVENRSLGRGMRLLTEVDLLGAPPGGYQQMLAVWGHLGAAMDALTARTSRQTTRTVGGVTYPGYQLAAVQTTPC